MPTYRLLVEYEGTKFAGWQAQASGRTVQGVLLEVLRGLTGERGIDLQGAGRTDAGVHALGQVASLRCRGTLDPGGVLRSLERELPADLAVLDLRRAPRGFHARHDATGRAYRYQIATRRSAFGKRSSWWVPEELDLAAMQQAASAFAGRHDFRAFARRPREAESTIVEVETCVVAATLGCVLARVVASHFVWNQVRRMVGALVTVGRGEARPADVDAWLSGSRPPPLTAPAAGLFLEAVRYGEEPFVLPPLVPVGLPPRFR
ncbi:MAG TPA: tRNA pseudouridine(38-40) synthase TruA [Thermoanaerobaculaceae bacterium]|nr:tRNA pseudouridine(38-40) synthase TruA [Thermoanaerobaculaceae bacterium]